MACALCTISFAPPSTLSPSRKSLSDGNAWWIMHSRSSSFNRVSSQTMARTAINRMSSNSLAGAEFTMNRRYDDNRLKASSHLCGQSACYVQTIISGYWVGPDVEDGWGYVEASVNRVLALHV